MNGTSSSPPLSPPIQYSAKVKFAEAPRDSDTQVEWKKMENSMSDSRKIFRLGKFLDELDDMRRVVQNTAEQRWSIKIITLVMHFFAFNYYFLDNVLWAMNIGLLKNIRTNSQGFKDSRFSKQDIVNMKNARNYQSLYRLVLATVAIVPCGSCAHLLRRLALRRRPLLCATVRIARAALRACRRLR